MCNKINYRLLIVFMISLLSLGATSASAVDIYSTWDGGGDGVNWSDAANWDPDILPLNKPNLYFYVTIPSSNTVNYDITESCEEISGLENSGRLYFLSDTCLKVLVTAEIYGIIDVDDGSFDAQCPGAAFPGNTARVYAKNTAKVVIAAPEYSSKGLYGYNTYHGSTQIYELFKAADAGTLLDLSSVNYIDAGFNQTADYNNNDYIIHQINSSDLGRIDLSGLHTVTSPYQSSDRIEFNIISENSKIDLSSLQILESAGHGGVRFNLSNKASIDLPALQTIIGASSWHNFQFNLTNGSEVSTGDLNVEAVTYISLDGSSKFQAGNLDISKKMTYNLSGASRMQTGDFNTSAVSTITLAGASLMQIDDFNTSAASTITLDGASSMQMDDFNISADATITLDGGSILRAGSIKADAGNSTITLNDPNERLYIGGTLLQDDPLAIAAPKGGKVYFGQDYSYTLTDEDKMQLAKAVVQFDSVGSGVRHLEVGGVDVYTYIELLINDNFGFGRLLVGTCHRPMFLQLQEEIDNGNRAGGSEALYLFGVDGENGLRILNGSILFIGDINVYTIKDGEIIWLNDKFPPGEDWMEYDEGWVVKGSCADYLDVVHNMIDNGGFENGTTPPEATDLFRTLALGSTDITGWTVTPDAIDWVHEAYFTDPNVHIGAQRCVDLSGGVASNGGVSQTIATQRGYRYYVCFDLGANPWGNLLTDPNMYGEKLLGISAGEDSTVFSFDVTAGVGAGLEPAPDDPWEVYWQRKSWSFVATDTTTTLEFTSLDDPATPYGVAIDNVVVIESGFQPLPGDMDRNNEVNILDLYWFGSHWLEIGCDIDNHCCNQTDINEDGIVNMADFALFSQHWQTER